MQFLHYDKMHHVLCVAICFACSPELLAICWECLDSSTSLMLLNFLLFSGFELVDSFYVLLFSMIKKKKKCSLFVTLHP